MHSPCSRVHTAADSAVVCRHTSIAGGRLSVGWRWTLAAGLAFVAAAAHPVAGQSLAASEPLTLPRLLDLVAARHPLTDAARARVQAARGSRITAGTFGNPVLSYDVENARLPGRDLPLAGRETRTTVTVPLAPLYQRGPRLRRAEGDVRAAEADAAVARQQVLLGAARAFYAAALAQVELEAARDLGSWLDTIVTYNGIRVAEGAAAGADLLRSRLERDRAGMDAALGEATLARAVADVRSFLDDAALSGEVTVIAFSDTPMALPAPPAESIVTRVSAREILVARPGRADSTLARLVSAALAGRGEVRGARERLAAAEAGVASERRSRVRELGATVGTKRSEGGTTSLLAGVSVPLPLFDQNRGEIMRATAERDAAAFELAAEERVVRAEVRGAQDAARILTDRVAALAAGEYLARADDTRRIALGAYREGAIPLAQVIDAARARGEARLSFYRALFAQHESVLLFLAAEGIDPATALPARGVSPRTPSR